MQQGGCLLFQKTTSRHTRSSEKVLDCVWFQKKALMAADLQICNSCNIFVNKSILILFDHPS